MLGLVLRASCDYSTEISIEGIKKMAVKRCTPLKASRS